MSKICIIPARGLSKRIPRKNIKMFLGRPIIEYSIKVALESGLFEEVMVSTDDPEIAQVATRNGATVPFVRSKKNSNDYATTADVLLEVLEDYRKSNKTYAYGCCIYPTALFITSEKLRSAFEIMNKKKYDSVFPVIRYSHPIQRAMYINDEKISMFQPEHSKTRSQDLKNAYHDAGQFYWFDMSFFEKEGKILSSNSGVVIVNELEAQDIDTEEDWSLAELKYKLFLKAR